MIVLLAGVIIFVVVSDFESSRPEQQGGNPYEYNIDEFSKVDPSLVIYRETRNIQLDKFVPRGICYSSDKIYLISDSLLQVISREGVEIARYNLFDSPRCIAVSGKYIFIGFIDYIVKLDLNGELLEKWEKLGERTVLTSLALKDKFLFAADAGNRKVIRYSVDGRYLGAFNGNSTGIYKHAFIIPSPCFDLAVNAENELWVVNPGLHAIENYTDDGKLRTYWENSSINIEGFSGCCNPAQMAIFPDGTFVTAEKGLVRIKIYKPSGEFYGVVATPGMFKEDGQAPDLAVTPAGDIYALDFDKNRIRVFQPK